MTEKPFLVFTSGQVQEDDPYLDGRFDTLREAQEHVAKNYDHGIIVDCTTASVWWLYPDGWKQENPCE